MNALKLRTRLATLLMLLFAQHSAQALQMTCKSYNSFSGNSYEQPNNHTLLDSMNYLDCRTSRGESIAVDLFGIGPGMRLDMGNLISISCPLIKESKLMRKLKQNGKFSLFGADAAADAVVGARLGFFINARGGICVLSGVSLALGASVEVAALTFFKQGNDQSREQRGPKNTNVFLENIFAW